MDMLFMNYYSVRRDVVIHLVISRLFYPSLVRVLSTVLANNSILFSRTFAPFASRVYFIINLGYFIYEKNFSGHDPTAILNQVFMYEFSKLSEGREGLSGIINSLVRSRSGSYGMILDTGGSYICKARACAPRTREVLARARICDHVGCSRGY